MARANKVLLGLDSVSILRGIVGLNSEEKEMEWTEERDWLIFSRENWKFRVFDSALTMELHDTKPKHVSTLGTNGSVKVWQLIHSWRE